MNASVALSNTPHPPRLRARDFLLLNESGAFADYARTELIDGEILCMNAEHSPHARLKSLIARRLGNALESLGSEFEAWAEPSVLLGDDAVPQPDIVVTNHKGGGPAPRETIALVIEVSDTTLTRDLGQKARVYAKAGVPEYWVADLAGRRMRQFSEPTAEGYAKSRDYAFGVQVVSVAVTGLSLTGFQYP